MSATLMGLGSGALLTLTYGLLFVVLAERMGGFSLREDGSEDGEIRAARGLGRALLGSGALLGVCFLATLIGMV